jgi:hypothetical protein
MLISTPFLKSGSIENNTDSIQLAFSGQYPLTSHVEWHNGQHLIAPQENGDHLDVRAIADGKVIYIVTPDREPSNSKDHAQNYAAFGGDLEWTDKGMVIIEHTTEIGADGNTPTPITFYSVYAHLRELGPGIAKDKRVYRKDLLGKPGQIYGQAGHMHFEIFLDDANIQRLLGQDPKDWPTADAVPTHDGRIDAVFGSTYVYLPANTPVQTAAPTKHVQSTASQTLNAPQWVQISYAGNATFTSYQDDGSEIGKRTDVDAEYDLYKEANTRHNSLATGDKAVSSPSAWYELLRFGRNLGRGSAATDKDPLPVNAAHWRKIVTPDGDRWADLNAAGTFKFSDADFPSFLGWNCFGDDEKVTDQRCDSRKLKALLTSEIPDVQDKARALKEPLYLFAQTRQQSIATKLRKAICKFPTEFDQGDFEARYGHIKEEEYFKSDATGKNWALLSDHIKALTVMDLPDAYKGAQWHLHPLAFIEVMRKCGWLSKSELKQCVPNKVIRHQKYKPTPVSILEHRYHWDTVNFTAASNFIDTQCVPLNRMLRKFCITTPMRQASFLGNAIQETGWFGALQETGGNSLWYAPWFGRGYLQLTFPSNYVKYWRWSGRTIPQSLEAALLAAENTAQHTRSNAALANKNFPQMTAEITDWRDNLARLLSPEAAQSAGWYWAMSNANRHADGTHTLDRQTVSAFSPPHTMLSYYRSIAFWETCAIVNLPSKVNEPGHISLNGFVDRCCAYAQVLMVVSETQFDTPNGTSYLPETLTPRRV